MANQNDIGSTLYDANAQAGQGIFDGLKYLAMLIPRVTAQAGAGLGTLSTYRPGGDNSTMGQSMNQNMAQAYNDPLKAIMGEVAKKSLTKNLSAHADNLLATNPQGAQILATHIPQPQQLGTGNQGGLNGPLTTSSPIDQQVLQAQQANQQVQPQAQPPQQAGQNPLEILGQLLKNSWNGGVDAMMAPIELQKAQAGQLRQQTQNMTPKGALALKTAEGEAPLSTLEAAQWGPQGIQERTLEAGGFTAQKQAYTDQIKSLDEQEKNLNDYLKQQQGIAKDLPGGMWFHQDLIKNVQGDIQKVRDYRTSIQKSMDALVPKQPNFPGKSNGGGGTVQIRNKKTGETKTVSAEQAKKMGAV